jgi:hypothetical protein
MLLSYNSILGMPVDESKNDETISNFEINPRMIIILAVIVGLFVILFGSLGNGGNKSTPLSSPSLSPASTKTSSPALKILELLIGGIVIAVIVLSGVQYFFNINLTARLTNFFSSQPDLDIIVKDTEPGDTAVPPVPEIKLKKQVFHIPGNKYTYNNAKALCDAYGARLANYNEIEKAYRNGAEWCSFGWTQDQLALYPTQKKTWEYLQGVEGHEHDCGRPGINGGFIANPNVRFGATCYGYRPKITEEEAEIMENTPIYPRSMSDIRHDKKVEFWKRRIPNILVAPFNRNVWSFI